MNLLFFGMSCFLAGCFAASHFRYGEPVSISEWSMLIIFMAWFLGQVIIQIINNEK